MFSLNQLFGPRPGIDPQITSPQCEHAKHYTNRDRHCLEAIYTWLGTQSQLFHGVARLPRLPMHKTCPCSVFDWCWYQVLNRNIYNISLSMDWGKVIYMKNIGHYVQDLNIELWVCMSKLVQLVNFGGGCFIVKIWWQVSEIKPSGLEMIFRGWTKYQVTVDGGGQNRSNSPIV